MVKNIVIIFLFVLVVLLFITNWRNVKALVEETKMRVKHQMDLANLLETSTSSTEKPVVNPSTGAQTT